MLSEMEMLERLAIVRAALDEIPGGLAHVHALACGAIGEVRSELERRGGDDVERKSAALHGQRVEFPLFHERLREAIDKCAAQLDDRRRLIVEVARPIIEVLRASPDWKPLPSCFAGDARFAGSFAGVPVRVEYNTTGALIVLDGGVLATVPCEVVQLLIADAKREGIDEPRA